MNRILICMTCEPAGSGLKLESAVSRVLEEADFEEEIAIGRVNCMGACAQPVALALQGTDRASYLFSGLTSEDSEDVAATCRLYLTSDAGWIEDARGCGRLRHCLRARIPAI